MERGDNVVRLYHMREQREIGYCRKREIFIYIWKYISSSDICSSYIYIYNLQYIHIRRRKKVGKIKKYKHQTQPAYIKHSQY